MFILMWAGGMPFNGGTIPDGKSLGGSETAAYYVAKELVATGHNVVVFTAEQSGGKWDGVTYEWHGPITEQHPLGERFHFCAQIPFDVAIIQRHPLAYRTFVNAKIRVLWNHDLALRRSVGAIHQSVPFLDFIFAVSNWHRDQIASVYEIDKRHIIATSNGIDYAAFAGIELGLTQAREPRTLLYTARPERGLENLVKPGGIMEQLPDCKLFVCGYDNTQPQMRSYYEYLWSRCEALPNVVNLGHLGKRALYEKEAQVMLHVYPTTFEDTSCIAAMEAQAAGTPFISSQIAALPETCRNAGAVLLPLLANQQETAFKVNQKLFAKTVKRILDGTNEWKDLHEKALAYRRPWSDVAKQWVEVFRARFAENCDRTTENGNRRMAKHLERYSDIVAADKAGISMGDNYRFYYEGTYAEHYQKYYQYEKDRGVVYGPELLDGNNRFETICRQIARLTAGKTDEELAAFSVLDYGCAHGHYVMNLRRRFPKIGTWVGIDIDQSNIDKAMAWREQDRKQGDGEVYFYQGTADKLMGILIPLDLLDFNIVMANEVLEHVPDPQAVIEDLRPFFEPKGWFIGSVPYGPWEAIGYDAHPGWRAHLHHFERQDLIELFDDQPEFQNIAVPHYGELGHFVVVFQAGGPEIGAINYTRKLQEQAPRQTIAACLIVKNEQHKIGQCVSKLMGLVDEIVIGIDATTTDQTPAVVQHLDLLPNAPQLKIITIPSPCEIGFDAARNLTIAETACDWILWIDADEQLENAPALAKYLRSTPVDGIAIAQHHLGVNPPGVQKSDFPCRLFRNGRGVKFFGMVHEHPERSLNAGMGKVIIADGAAIGHYGYSTEDIRRQRFLRNFPLMEQDRKKYPTRDLGIMLWVRDLAHVVRYEVERSHGQMTDRAVAAAQEAIETWRRILYGKQNDHSFRLLLESLPFSSECVNALHGGGIEMAINLNAIPSMLGKLTMPPQPIVGLFQSVNDAKRFNEVLTGEVLDPIEKKYL